MKIRIHFKNVKILWNVTVAAIVKFIFKVKEGGGLGEKIVERKN
jgi:hypothetical protein